MKEALDERTILEGTQRTSSLDLHLKMIEEQNQLEELAREKMMRIEQEKHEAKESYEEQEKWLEEEMRQIQIELKQAQEEKLIMENERLRLLAAQEELEKQKILEEERMREEQEERQRQQLMAKQALKKIRGKEETDCRIL